MAYTVNFAKVSCLLWGVSPVPQTPEQYSIIVEGIPLLDEKTTELDVVEAHQASGK